MSSIARWLPFAIGLPLAGLFLGLGAWQVARLGERREANEAFASRFALPPLELGLEQAGDLRESPVPAGRRVEATGRWAPEGELVVRGQAYLGTPGVTVLTPLVTDAGLALLVLRGWLPAADGLAADLPLASLDDSGQSVTVEGLALDGQSPSGLPIREAAYPDRVRPVLGTIDIAAADSLLPWSLAPFYVQLIPDSATRTTLPPGQPLPLPPPPLTDGPHALYAFQWFGFAAISLAAAFLLPKASRQATVLSDPHAHAAAPREPPDPGAPTPEIGAEP
jgi:surfeit locus 1 family protein